MQYLFLHGRKCMLFRCFFSGAIDVFEKPLANGSFGYKKIRTLRDVRTAGGLARNPLLRKRD